MQQRKRERGQQSYREAADDDRFFAAPFDDKARWDGKHSIGDEEGERQQPGREEAQAEALDHTGNDWPEDIRDERHREEDGEHHDHHELAARHWFTSLAGTILPR